METASEAERRKRAHFLVSCGVAAAMVAVLAMLSVLFDSAFALKFETGSLPTGFDPVGAQAAMIFSIACAVAALALVGAGAVTRTTWFTGTVALLGALATPVYGLLAFVSLQLAFG